ncbi:cysteine sulfinate desulfinase/cysteine desulfurase [Longilinea arvoryzae]|uniref:cysteine desulfurase n=1 Tax=Longilinea arvoryzae TaxID=360412 RepID=A0A0S7BAQ5_9CHLR|nr:cysteine desulfurase family protein [Longilinea arvoryzae]GAP14647.1 cysteine sulfinate desulfinase/cysteine desulfurase [Longilinea arvoryzae]
MSDINSKIYLDYAATTPVDSRVLDAMLPYFSEYFGNPSSVHGPGQLADAALEEARRKVASLLGARSEEILFTGCGTESDNLALRGAAMGQRRSRGAYHILISPVEHHAVLHTVQQLEAYYGFDVETLPVDPYGRVDPQDVKASLRPTTALVSVIYANNEIGTINPVAQIGEVCREAGVLFHTDAVQAAAHLPMNVQLDNIDLMSIGAHKFYGPKGVGALYIRRGVEIIPAQTGGGQEFHLRAGTQNVPYIVGLARALEIAQTGIEERSGILSGMRDHLIERVVKEIPDARLTGHPQNRLPNHASFVFKGVDGNQLLMMLDAAGFACSSGSACKVGNPKPSEVLEAIGVMPAWNKGSLRVTLGHGTTPEHIDQLMAVLPGIVDQLRKLSAV